MKPVSAAILASIVFSAGCSGGGGGTPAAPTTLSGTAAAGAPLIGQVTVKGALGNTTSAFIEADGSYTVDVTGLTAPYRLRAEGTVGGRTYRLHSYAETSDVGGTVNITPFTDLIIANAAQQLASNFFDSTTTTELDPVVVDTQEEALQAKLQNVFNAMGLGTAIDLLNQSFSADHSGLDAALDIINISVDENSNVATITNLVEPTNFITDSIVDTTDNTETVTVTDATTLTTAVSDTQAIANVFNNLTAAFANGLPTQTAIQNYFADTFYESDNNKSLLLTDITTDPTLIGIMFNNVVVKNLDSTAGTADVTFNFGLNGVIDPEPETWEVIKDPTLGWQVNGDQRIVEAYFDFHCNDYDGAGSWTGSCGINTRFWDNDFTNNGTGNAPIASGTVKIIDGTDGVTVKDIVYLGTPVNAAPGDVQVYNESFQNYSGDWKGFGTGTGEIDSSIFVAGDIIEYAAYTEALDISNPTAPALAMGAVPVASYTETLLFVPGTVGKYPTAIASTQTAISNFTLGNNLTVAWTLEAGTRNDEVLVQISDASGNSMETWIETIGTTSNSVTFASVELDATAATNAGLDPNAASYELRVRIYAADPLTGQEHSRDYSANIPGQGAVGGGSCDTTGITTLAAFESVMDACGTVIPMNAADLIGNSFTFVGATNEVTTYTDASNGTFTNDGGATVSPITWSIDGRGYLTISYTVGMQSFYDVFVAYGVDGTTSGLMVKAFTNENNSVFEEIIIPVGGSSSSLTCGYDSGWNDLADGGLGAPINPNSFTDFETVIQDCLGGSASTFTAADIENTSYLEGGVETSTFNALAGAAGTAMDPGTGTYDDGAGFVISFQWWVEAATCSGCNHSYVVVYSDSTLDADLPAGLWFRETTAITGAVGALGVPGTTYTMYRYAEQSNYSDADRANAADGEIWFSADNVLQ